ncbi:hypothetical protein ACJJTC_008647 [Scirpophaga incertulas]
MNNLPTVISPSNQRHQLRHQQCPCAGGPSEVCLINCKWQICNASWLRGDRGAQGVSKDGVRSTSDRRGRTATALLTCGSCCFGKSLFAKSHPEIRTKPSRSNTSSDSLWSLSTLD